MRLRPAIILDRDGTIIVEKEYLCEPDEVELERDATRALSRLAAAGYLMVVVSNQSGIGRGRFDLSKAEAVNSRVAELLMADGIAIAGWYMCPHRPDAACQCRKPMPGMALAAAADHGLDLNSSFVLGDKRSDVELARAIDAKGILLCTGHGRHDVAWAEREGIPVCANLDEAATLILVGKVTTNNPTEQGL